MASLDEITIEQDQLIAQAMEKDGSRLRNYIRKQVLDRDATEDILQDVFSELVEAYRLLKPIEQVSAWLFRVAKNRIIDRFRGKKLESLSDAYGMRMTIPFRWAICFLRWRAARRRPMPVEFCSTSWTRRWMSYRKNNARSLSSTSWKVTASKSWRPKAE